MSDFKDFLKENEQTVNSEKIVSEIASFLRESSKIAVDNKKKYRPMKRKYQKRTIDRKTILVDREFDILKYYGIVKRYFAIVNGLTFDEIEMMMYFYSEPIFTKKEFDIYCKACMGRGKQLHRFLELGLVEAMPGNDKIKTSTKKLYRLTKKANLKVSDIYKKLLMINEFEDRHFEGVAKHYESGLKNEIVAGLMIEYNKRRSELLLEKEMIKKMEGN